ncbi:MAG: hypothetical protein PHY62_02830 [Gallionella sp.]|nr:hypothetical protein [Gallionella sp.]
MPNSIDARVEFSFKGEDYLCSATLNLDELLQQHDDLPVIHELLAQKHGIDTYSYLFEVMLVADIEFSNPQGLALRYMKDGEFDFVALDDDWARNKALMQVRLIAAADADITDLEQHPALQRALLAAYNSGKKV